MIDYTKIYKTSNPAELYISDHNRQFEENKKLEQLMLDYAENGPTPGGWKPSKPAWVYLDELMRKILVTGHHRLHYALKHGWPIYYMILPERQDPQDEFEGERRWSLYNYMWSLAKQNVTHCQYLVSLKEKWDAKPKVGWFRKPNGIPATLINEINGISKGQIKTAGRHTRIEITNTRKQQAHLVMTLLYNLWDSGEFKWFNNAMAGKVLSQIVDMNCAGEIDRWPTNKDSIRKTSAPVKSVKNFTDDLEYRLGKAKSKKNGDKSVLHKEANEIEYAKMFETAYNSTIRVRTKQRFWADLYKSKFDHSSKF